ncbi:hypothetical protein ASH02_17955, partial [Nocardioides sp. Soil796]
MVLGVVSAAWTASLVSAGTGAASVAAPSTSDEGAVTVPSQAIEDPASYSQPGEIGLGVPRGSGDKIVQTASTNGIP